MQHQKIDLYEFLVGLGDFGIQAKLKHKQEIMDAFNVGLFHGGKLISTGEQYYNETFKNQENGKV
jgi:hypothetical protein